LPLANGSTQRLIAIASVVEMAKIVAQKGGSPTLLVASDTDIENVLTEAMSQQRYQAVIRESGAGPLERIHTEYGVIEPLRHPLIPRTGTRYAYLLDPDRMTDFGPSVHMRYPVSREPFRVDIPDTRLELVRFFMHVCALVVPGRHWQAKADITNA